MKLAALLVARSRFVLLDLDGPVTQLLPPPANERLAHLARDAAKGVDLPGDVATTKDHLLVVRWLQQSHPHLLETVEKACTAGELAYAERCVPSPGAVEFVRWYVGSGRPIAIVTNNSARAAETVIERCGLGGDISAIVGRTPDRPDLMKPHPWPLERAVSLLGARAREGLMLGDSRTDIAAARALGMPTLGVALNVDLLSEIRQADAAIVTLASLGPFPNPAG